MAEKINAYLSIEASVRRAGIHECVSKSAALSDHTALAELAPRGEIRNKTGVVSLPSDLIECVSVGAAERRASMNAWVQDIRLSTRGSLCSDGVDEARARADKFVKR